MLYGGTLASASKNIFYYQYVTLSNDRVVPLCRLLGTAKRTVNAMPLTKVPAREGHTRRHGGNEDTIDPRTEGMASIEGNLIEDGSQTGHVRQNRDVDHPQATGGHGHPRVGKTRIQYRRDVRPPAHVSGRPNTESASVRRQDTAEPLPSYGIPRGQGKTWNVQATPPLLARTLRRA